MRVSAGPASGVQPGHLLAFLFWMLVCVMGHSCGEDDLQTDNDDPGSLSCGLCLPGIKAQHERRQVGRVWFS